MTPLSVRLREATAAAHDRIETTLDIFGPSLDTNRYARLLERWHGFEITWQRMAARTLASTVPDGFLIARQKLHLLRSDLLACGRSVDAIDRLPVIPESALPWEDRAGALGVLYVAEGSTLGGQHIAKAIRNSLDLTPDHGVAYFTSYGAEVGTRWRETKRFLDADLVADKSAVIAGANAAFEFLTSWLR